MEKYDADGLSVKRMEGGGMELRLDAEICGERTRVIATMDKEAMIVFCLMAGRLAHDG